MAGLFMLVLLASLPLLPVQVIIGRFIPWSYVIVPFALLMYASLLVLYAMSRMGYHRYTIRLAVIINTVLLFMAASTLGDRFGLELMYFMLLHFFISIMFTTMRFTLLAAGLHITGMLAVGLNVDRIPLESVITGPLAFYAIVGMFLTQYFYYYRRLETNRQYQLAMSEARYRAIVEDQTEMIARFRLDDRMTLTYANRAYADTFQFDPAQIPNIGIRDVVSAAHFAYLQQCYTRFKPENPEHIDVEQVEFKDGSQRWHYWRARAFFDEKGQVTEVQCVGHDVTEEKHAEEQAAELARERERVMILQNLIGDVSHDLMTPLTVINSNLHLLQRVEDPDRQQYYVERAREQVARLQGMIKDMLNMSRLDQATQSELPLVERPLEPLLIKLVRLHQPVARLKRQTLVLAADIPDVTVRVDPDRIQIALSNLVDNAIKYTSSQGKIRVSAQAENGTVTITVADNGDGIQPKDLPHIFDRFYRSETHRPTNSGSGLGLSITRKVIDLHGGEITAESQPGEGTSFIIKLPVASPQPAAPRAGTHDPEISDKA